MSRTTQNKKIHEEQDDFSKIRAAVESVQEEQGGYDDILAEDDNQFWLNVKARIAFCYNTSAPTYDYSKRPPVSMHYYLYNYLRSKDILCRRQKSQLQQHQP